MRIITISRQFGSGGRELGKRLADRLGWDYYDKEIIDTLAAEHGLDPEYVKRALANHGWHNVQLTYRNSFSHLLYDPGHSAQLLRREREVLRDIAALGYHPFRIFVCADLQARLARCMGHEANRPQEERLTEKQILRNIRRIDRNRANTREILTGKASGDGSAFELTVNTTGWDIKKLTEALGDFAEKWFEVQ